MTHDSDRIGHRFYLLRRLGYDEVAASGIAVDDIAYAEVLERVVEEAIGDKLS